MHNFHKRNRGRIYGGEEKVGPNGGSLCIMGGCRVLGVKFVAVNRSMGVVEGPRWSLYGFPNSEYEEIVLEIWGKHGCSICEEVKV